MLVCAILSLAEKLLHVFGVSWLTEKLTLETMVNSTDKLLMIYIYIYMCVYICVYFNNHNIYDWLALELSLCEYKNTKTNRNKKSI